MRHFPIKSILDFGDIFFLVLPNIAIAVDPINHRGGSPRKKLTRFPSSLMILEIERISSRTKRAHTEKYDYTDAEQSSTLFAFELSRVDQKDRGDLTRQRVSEYRAYP